MKLFVTLNSGMHIVDIHPLYYIRTACLITNHSLLYLYDVKFLCILKLVLYLLVKYGLFRFYALSLITMC